MLQHLAVDPPPLLLTTMQALMQPVPDRAGLAARARPLRVGETLDLDEFAAWLVEHGYQRVEAVELPGEFTRRGGILDVFSPDAEAPVSPRVLRRRDRVDPPVRGETQRSLGDLKTAGVLPPYCRRLRRRVGLAGEPAGT